MNMSLVTFAQTNAAGADTGPLNAAGASPIAVFENGFSGRIDLLNHPENLISVLTQVHPVWAGIFVVVGALCILNGFRWHKIVIVLLSGMLGVAAGMWLGDRIGGAHTVTGVALTALFMILALPGLRFAVALFGGLAGAFVGANAWTALGGTPDMHHFGAMFGLIALGMLAFMTFRLVIVLFTTILGASLLVLGALALMLTVEAWRGAISESLTVNSLVVPLVVTVTALIGIIVQQGGGLKGLNTAANNASAAKKPKPA
ncbi:MAG: hypothetical protein EA376_05525 [Phycisphaeraceae bacterium]|nr:MAG: hypothetical protein EA376_05525 [Phycisphaeraceae bacterium]